MEVDSTPHQVLIRHREDNETISLFLVTSFYDGPYCGAIYEIKLEGSRGGGGGGGSGGRSEIPILNPLEKLFHCREQRCIRSVGSDIDGSNICLVASSRAGRSKITIPYGPLVFDTNIRKLSPLQMPNSTKSYPTVMALEGSGFYVLAGGTISPAIDMDEPYFEHLDFPYNNKWDSSSLPPQFHGLVKNSSMIVSGFVVINEYFLVSILNLHPTKKLEDRCRFYCYHIGSSEDWRPVEKELEKETRGNNYVPFHGKAFFVGGLVYTFVDEKYLVAYGVKFSPDGDCIIQSLAPPVYIPLNLPPLPSRCRGEPTFSPSLLHMGHNIFCLISSRFVNGDLNYVSIVIIYISEDLQVRKLSSHLCALNTKGLGQNAILGSLFSDSRRSIYDYRSEFWTGVKVRSGQYEDIYVDTHMQPVNTDPSQMES